MPRLPRLEALVGGALADLTETSIQALIAGSVREDVDLDFKAGLYGSSDTEKRDLAGDVAALANSVGGALILGVNEVDAVATGVNPVALSDAEELRMRQIVAANTAPYVAFTIHRVPLDADATRGFYVLEVPRSAAAPHAVVVNHALRYPRRAGASIRWLSESEVADAYRDRFAGAREQVERLAVVRREGEAALPEPADHAWVSLAVVPNLPGQMPITRDTVNAMRQFPRTVPCPSFTDSPLYTAAPNASAGHRRVVLTLGERSDGTPNGGVVHLHQDGAAFVGILVGREAKQDGASLGFLYVNDEWLTQEVISSLAVAVAHAVSNCGAGGDAAVEATLVSRLPMFLHHGRGGFENTWNDRPVEVVPVGRHTISLDEVGKGGPDLVIAARLVLADIVQGFGVAESPQLTEGGGVRLDFFRSENHRRVRQEADRCGLPVL